MSFLDALKIAGAALASIGSASAIMWALSSWLGKVWASRILEQDRVKYAREIEQLKAEYGREIEGLKTELEKTVFVSRIQFETEFKALADIWRNVADLRGSISELRPIGLHMVQRGVDENEAFNNRFREYARLLDGLLKSVHHNSPFYPEDIHAQLVALLQTANAEYVDCALDEPRDQEWRQRGIQNREEFMTAADRLSDLIRKRLRELAVYVPQGGNNP